MSVTCVNNLPYLKQYLPSRINRQLALFGDLLLAHPFQVIISGNSHLDPVEFRAVAQTCNILTIGKPGGQFMNLPRDNPLVRPGNLGDLPSVLKPLAKGYELAMTIGR